MAKVDREGVFRARPVAWKLVEGKQDTGAAAKSISVGITFVCDAWFEKATKIWHPWEPYDQQVDGFFTVINKDGTVNEINAGGLRDGIGWAGDLGEFVEGGRDFSQASCNITVKLDSYKNRNELRAAYIAQAADVPQDSQMDKDAIAAARMKFGAQLRAFCGQKQAAPAAPNGAPPAPRSVPGAPPAGRVVPGAPRVPAAPPMQPPPGSSPPVNGEPVGAGVPNSGVPF